jgi:hypothetical protein
VVKFQAARRFSAKQLAASCNDGGEVFRRFRSVLILGLALWAPVTFSQTKRALLIGIDTYEAHGRPIPKINAPDTAGPSRFDLLQWPDLDGAVNDVKSMQALLVSPKFGFPSDAVHMHVLVQNQATRDAILAAMQKYLVDEPASGDIVVFYYAGHGSLRYNSKSTKRSNHLDNTIVPSDAYTGTFDVRDREIARIFNAALDKGVKLTAIFDSCHSGTIARGIPLGTQGKKRYLAYDPRDINEGPDLKDGKEVVAPEDRQPNGALVFSATQPDQLAEEWPSGNEAHGAFTMAVIEALKAVPADASAEDVYKRVKVMMESMGLVDQQPMLDGSAARRRQPLFSGSGGSSKLRAAVASVSESGGIVLDAGMASELGPGSELVQVTQTGQLGSTRIRVQQVTGLTRSSAEVVSGAGAKIAVGDLFEVAKWVPLQSNVLNVWTAPPTLGQEEIAAAVRELALLHANANVTLVEDPARQAPTHMISWDGQQWKLSSAGSAESTALGAKFSASAIAGALKSGEVRLLVNLPPSRELTQQLQSEDGASAMQVVKDPREALYVLVGATQAGQLRYSWFRKSALEQASTRSGQASVSGVCSEDSPYPMRSDWVSVAGNRDTQAAADGLATLASRLAKVHAWLSLPTPEGDGGDFPYHLALKRVSDGTLITDAPTHEADQYDLVLKADHAVTASVSPRWVYVLNIDCSGQGTLLFPNAGGENKFPIEGGATPEITLPRVRIGIGAPFGLDTYILLTTDQQLSDPGALNFEGAATRGARAAGSPLQSLLGDASHGTRGASVAVPTDWSVQYLHLHSLPKGAGTGTQ